MTSLQRRLRDAAPFAIVRERDLLYFRTDEETAVAVACDSDGGLGPKPHDPFPCPAYQLGRFAARVPLLELLAVGARPILLVDTLSVELEPTGVEIIRGVVDEAALAGLDRDAVTGSTEDNIPTVSTGVGVTVLGVAPVAALAPGSSRSGSAVLLVGHPKSGPDDVFTDDDPDILSLPAMQALVELPGVHEIVPVGSRGVAHECGVLAASSGLAFVDGGTWPVRRDQSGGPGTTCVAAVDVVDDPEVTAREVSATVGAPVWWIGSLG